MNANRLHDVAKFLIELDSELALQARLQTVRDTLNTLTSSPADASTQTAFSNALQALAEGFQAIKSKLTPGQTALITEIGGREFFDPSLSDEVKAAIVANPITPAVVRDKVGKLFTQRSESTFRILSRYSICLRNSALRAKPCGRAQQSLRF